VIVVPLPSGAVLYAAGATSDAGAGPVMSVLVWLVFVAIAVAIFVVTLEGLNRHARREVLCEECAGYGLVPDLDGEGAQAHLHLTDCRSCAGGGAVLRTVVRDRVGQ